MRLTEEEIQIIREVIAFMRSRRTGEDVTIAKVTHKTGVLSALCDRATRDDAEAQPSTRVVAIERRIGDMVTRTEFA